MEEKDGERKEFAEVRVLGQLAPDSPVSPEKGYTEGKLKALNNKKKDIFGICNNFENLEKVEKVRMIRITFIFSVIYFKRY